MQKLVMDRKASDNEYLHKDFHGALSCALDYLNDNYGIDSVREYLWKFTKAYYSKLIEDIGRRGLAALQEYYENIYKIEGGKAEFSINENELNIKVDASPAVMHLRENGRPVSSVFIETIKTVNEALCDGSPYAFELLNYEEQTGASIQRFFRRDDR